MAHAAGTTPAKKAAIKTTIAAKTVKAEAAPQAAKVKVAKTATVNATAGTKLKADGTADMRFKANKTATVKTAKKVEAITK